MIYNIIFYYCIFALSIGITSYFTVYSVLFKLIDDNKEYTKKFKIVRFLTLVGLSSIAAPWLISITITGPSEEIIDSFIETYGTKK